MINMERDAQNFSLPTGRTWQRILDTQAFFDTGDISGEPDGYFNADMSGTDRYGRHLGRLYDNDIDINRELVEQGLAWVYDKYVTDKSFYDNQNSAKIKNRGLWQDSQSIPPWSWREKNRK